MEYRLQQWQAGTYDSQEGFERGQERDETVRILRVQVCGVADRGGSLDAVNCNGTDPAAKNDVSLSHWEDTRSWSAWEPYKIPIPNMQLNATFLLLAICNPHSIGMGKTTITTSCSRFKMAIYRSRDF